jgi:hypothetical protein
MSAHERSPFAKTFDRPLVTRPEWDAAIRRKRAQDRAWRRLVPSSPLNAPTPVTPVTPVTQSK